MSNDIAFGGVVSRLFASESVADGHPDKICDQISDAILDYCLTHDRMSRVAINVSVAETTVFVMGQLTSRAVVDYSKIVRDTFRKIGHDGRWGIDPDRLEIIVRVSQQSPEISRGVEQNGDNLGAGDQGEMFGYAVQETPELMPLPITLAHRLMIEHREVRIRGGFGIHLAPDAKSQVIVRYENDKPVELHNVVLSVQHSSDVSVDDIQQWGRTFIASSLREYAGLITSNTKFNINTAGAWTIGGPLADSGLTGRKIIIDTYGGAARHGGGAFSGKDATKVDRSAAYAARRFAQWIVRHTNRYRAEVQLAYAIGVPEPIGVHVYGMEEDAVRELVDLYASTVPTRYHPFSPAGMIESMDLRTPMFENTARFGHFGRPGFAWEIWE